MAWVLAKPAASLNAAFDAAFPQRQKTSDGTIGDLEHAQGVSGHNPDDTPGVTAERTDADTKAEVRATDRDKDLNDPRGVTMTDVLRSILATPRDRDRFIYFIWNSKIYRKSNGWREEDYTGDNSHTEHLHASGDPAFDEDGAPFESVLKFKIMEDVMDAAHSALLRAMGDCWSPNQSEYLAAGGSQDTWNAMAAAGMVGTNGRINKLGTLINKIVADMTTGFTKVGEQLTLLTQKVDALAAGGVTHEALVAALTDPAVTTAMTQAAQVGAEAAEDSP